MVSAAYKHENTQATIEWARKTAVVTADEAVRLGKSAAHSDLAKDAAAGAALGAMVAVPIPIVGPIAGAAVGAGLGMYKSITQPKSANLSIRDSGIKEKLSGDMAAQPIDVYDQLIKFDELKQKGIITDTEFDERKKKLLGN